MLTTIELEPRQRTPYGLAVVLHGRGANKEDLLGLGEGLVEDGWHCILPDALPSREWGLAWYEHPQQVLEPARAELTDLLKKNSPGFAETVVVGFSQGGVMALDLLLNTQIPSRVACLSGYLSVKDAPAKGRGKAFVAHGTRDPLVPIGRAREAKRELEARGVDITYHEFPIAHGVSSDEEAALREWLLGRP